MADLLSTHAPIPIDVQGRKDDVTAILRERVIKYKLDGWGYKDISRELDLSEDQVRRLIRAAVNEARGNERELVSERFHVQDQRLEHLYRKVIEHLNVATEFDEKLIRAAILICDRQARLLGLDRTRNTSGNSFDWLESATPAELVRLAGVHGIPLPEKFLVS